MSIATTGAFLDALRRHGLLESEQLNEAARDLAKRFPDPRTLAKDLVQRGWLTPYQVNQLFAGRGQELVLGPYVLLERLGEGGMGQVFKARHRKLARVVALKIIRKEMLEHPQAVQRFQREIHAAAKLDHPNIIHAYDADEVGSTHFFAMEYVDGIDLAKLLKRRGPLPVAEACDYIRQAALGLQHAHERGLVHRDIKPANLLVVSSQLSVAGRTVPNRDRQGAGSAAGPPLGGLLPHGRGSDVSPEGPFPTVKLLDMGLARLRNPVAADISTSTLTKQGTIMGTPDYIAPEQAMSSHHVDIRADLYSLGCTLYHLLTGKPPFPGGSIMDKLVRHRSEQPRPVESLRPGLPAELAVVIHKLLAKRPEERYQTPAELAQALEPFTREFVAPQTAVAETAVANTLLDQGLAATVPQAPEIMPRAAPATPPATLYQPVDQAQTWRPWVLGGGACVILFTGILVAFLVWMARTPDSSPESTQPAASQDRRDMPPAGVVMRVEANKPWQDAGVEIQANMPVTIHAKGQWQRSPSSPPCSATGEASYDRVLVADAPAMCLLMRIGTGETLTVVKPGQPFFPRVGGRLFVQANDLDLDDNSGALTLEIQGGTRQQAAATAPPTRLQAAEAEWKPLLAGAEDRKSDQTRLRKDLVNFRIQHWGTAPALRAAEILGKLPSPLDKLDPAAIPAEQRFEGQPKELVAILGDQRGYHGGELHVVAFHPQGKLVASGSSNGSVRLWDPATLQPRGLIKGPDACRFTADGKTLVCSGRGGVSFWDITGSEPRERGKRAGIAPGPAGMMPSPDGKALATRQGLDIRVWDLTGPEPKQTAVLKGPTEQINGMAFRPDGKMFAAGSHDRNVYVWDLSGPEPKLSVLKGHTDWVTPVAFSPDSKTLASGGTWDWTIKFWDCTGASPQLKQSIHMHHTPLSLAFAPDGKTLAAGFWNGDVVLFNMTDKGAQRRLSFKPHLEFVNSLAFAPDGKTLASCGNDGTVRIWDVTGSPKQAVIPAGHTRAVTSVVFTPDDEALISAGWDGTIRVWDTQTGKERGRFGENARAVMSLALHPSDRTVAAGNADNTVRLWNIDTGKELRRFGQPPGDVRSVAISPDGKMLSWSSDNVVRLCDLTKKEPEALLEGHARPVHCVAFSPDGHTLASGSWEGEDKAKTGVVKLWDVVTRRERETLRGHKAEVVALAFSPDGRILASGANDQTVKLWDWNAKKELATLTGFNHAVASLAFSPDGKRLASATKLGPIAKLGQIILWDVATQKAIQNWQMPGAVHGIAFASDGRHLAVAGDSSALYILRLSPPPGRAKEDE